MAKAITAPAFEYRLILSPHYNERKQISTTLLQIETTKAFASFRYVLSVREEIHGKELHYAILGIKAPQLDLPSSGTAQYKREHENLKGKYNITVESLDGSSVTFTVSFTARHIKILKSPKTSFIELVTA